MAHVSDRQRRMISLGDAGELQEWKVNRPADRTFEYHSYVGNNYNINGQKRLSAGAIWMLMRLSDPGSDNEEMLYRMGRTGVPGSGNDTLTAEWAARTVSTYYRFDEMLQKFFNG
jgi:hypothetical protein